SFSLLPAASPLSFALANATGKAEKRTQLSTHEVNHEQGCVRIVELNLEFYRRLRSFALRNVITNTWAKIELTTNLLVPHAERSLHLGMLMGRGAEAKPSIVPTNVLELVFQKVQNAVNAPKIVQA